MTLRPRPLAQVVGWVGVAAMSLCIVMSRKHYSVDVVVAWYTVPLVFYAMHRRWTTKRPVQDYWPHRPLQVRGAGWGAVCTVRVARGACVCAGALRRSLVAGAGGQEGRPAAEAMVRVENP